MRAPDDMPRSTRRPMGRGRVIIIVTVVILLVLLTSAQELSMAYTDFLWYESVNFTSVWKNVLFTKIALAVAFSVIFFVLLYVNLVIADRIAPKFRPLSPEDEILSRYQAMIERRAGWLRVVIAAFFGIILGANNSSAWQEWLLFSNGGDFGITDATFNQDIGFYVFKLPFISSTLNWFFFALVIVLLMTGVAHYLNGGIRLQVTTDRVSPQVKRHLSLLLAAMSLVKFTSYWFDRYALTFSRDGVVNGATYTPYHAELQAIQLLMFASAVGFFCFVVNIWRKGWVLPIVAVGLWALVALIAGEAYPAAVQEWVVQPAESDKEQPFIANNIAATRQSYGLDNVEARTFEFDNTLPATRAGAESNPSTVRNIRLLDPNVVQPAYQELQKLYAYYKFSDLDVDRYPITDNTGATNPTAVVIGGRDLATDSTVVTSSWENSHIAYTHGYGVALAAANGTTTSGSPDFLVSSVPVNIRRDKLATDLAVPGIYFGEKMPGYAITGATRDEVKYQEGNRTIEERYNGDGGVQIDSLLKRAAFWRRFGDTDILVSQFITDQSRIIYLRDVRDRVQAAAPFMTWDRDPYPILANGRVIYMIDGYTTSAHYPNAQYWDNNGAGEVNESTSIFNRGDFNYVRNSVKATVDSYDGKIKLYIWDEKDPIVNAYKSAFPGLFTDRDEMPQELQPHVRYPEDLFRLQTSMWGRYHLDKPLEFYQRSGAWSVAQEPDNRVQTNTNQQNAQTQGAQPAQQQQTPARQAGDTKIAPFYQEMRLPRESDDSFLLFRTFVPFSTGDASSTTSQKLSSFIVAKCDPADYGKLIVYELPNQTEVDGPSIVNSKINADQAISRDISLLGQLNSEVQFGNMLLIPFGDPANPDSAKGTTIYVRPLYVRATNRPIPELKKVIVAAGESGDSKIIMRDTLRQALDELLGTTNVTTLEGAPDPSGSGGTDQTTTTTVPPAGTGSTSTSSSSTTTAPGAPPTTLTGDVRELIKAANDLLTQADADLRNRDLAGYQDKVNKAAGKIAEANKLASGAETTTTTAPPAPST